MISIFRLAWLSVWKSTYTQHKHMDTHAVMVWILMVFHGVSVTVVVQCAESKGCVCISFVSAAACLCVWNECKRHQTPPLMGLINDRWNSCCFSHRSTVCSNRNKAQNVQRDWWDDWGWKSHLYSQPPYTNTHARACVRCEERFYLGRDLLAFCSTTEFMNHVKYAY